MPERMGLSQKRKQSSCWISMWRSIRTLMRVLKNDWWISLRIISFLFTVTTLWSFGAPVDIPHLHICLSSLVLGSYFFKFAFRHSVSLNASALALISGLFPGHRRIYPDSPRLRHYVLRIYQPGCNYSYSPLSSFQRFPMKFIVMLFLLTIIFCLDL